MNKEYLKINELEVGVVYDIVNNPFPNHIYYFIDEEGNLCNIDDIVKCIGKVGNYKSYNEVIKMNFVVASSQNYFKNYLNGKW